MSTDHPASRQGRLGAAGETLTVPYIISSTDSDNPNLGNATESFIDALVSVGR